MKENFRNRPQEPVKPYPYKEKEYKSSKDNITLSGTITIPDGTGLFPAVCIAAAGGPVDRDGCTYVEHKTYLVIADYLTRNGIAVLRLDKRGIGKSTGDYNEATTIDFAYDIIDGINELKKINYIDSNKIGIIGHSEGGIIAPIAASLTEDINFIVSMAGPGMKGDELMLLNTPNILRYEGIPEKEIEQHLELMKAAFEITRNTENEKETKNRIMRICNDILPTPATKLFTKEFYSEFYSTKWFKAYIDIDPKDYLISTKCPYLALNGKMDFAVPFKENLTLIKESLINAGNNNFTIKALEGISHSFQNAITGYPKEYIDIEETIAPKVLDIITGWILEQTGEDCN